tara:strand:- start:455 stop:715 length:261 start_codon:yes stop_codon:yes gene_type:complete
MFFLYLEISVDIERVIHVVLQLLAVLKQERKDNLIPLVPYKLSQAMESKALLFHQPQPFDFTPHSFLISSSQQSPFVMSLKNFLAD